MTTPLQKAKNRLRDTLKKAANLVGGQLLSNLEYNQLLTHRSRAVAKLTAARAATLKPGLSCIIFSKDRALQMHALLSSYAKYIKNPAPVTVIYNASTSAHAKAYAQVAKLFPKVTWVRESKKFREHLLDVLAATKTNNLFFLVDDIVFIRPLDLSLASKVDAATTCLSFRLAPTLNYCYTSQMAQQPPKFKKTKEAADLLEFRWLTPGNNEWSYPYSVDGHVFSTAEIDVLTQLGDFKAPNTYEGALMAFAALAFPRRGLCYTQARIVNLPINKVQNENANIAGEVSPEYLLEQWEAGRRMAFEDYKNITVTAPHMELPVRFVKR